MSSSEISFDNYLLCNLTINIKMLNCHAIKFTKWWEKGEMVLPFDVSKETKMVCAPLA